MASRSILILRSLLESSFENFSSFKLSNLNLQWGEKFKYENKKIKIIKNTKEFLSSHFTVLVKKNAEIFL